MHYPGCTTTQYLIWLPSLNYANYGLSEKSSTHLIQCMNPFNGSPDSCIGRPGLGSWLASGFFYLPSG